MGRLAALSLAISMVVPFAATAQEPVGWSRTYVGVGAGVAIPRNADLMGFTNAFAAEALFGYEPWRYAAFEVAIGHFATERSLSEYIYPGYPRFSIDTRLAATPLLLSAKLMLPIDPLRLRLHATVGGGTYSISARSTTSSAGYGTNTESASDQPLGVHFGGGLDVRILPRVRLGAEAKFIKGAADVSRVFCFSRWWCPGKYQDAYQGRNQVLTSFDSLIFTGRLTFLL